MNAEAEEWKKRAVATLHREFAKIMLETESCTQTTAITICDPDADIRRAVGFLHNSEERTLIIMRSDGEKITDSIFLYDDEIEILSQIAGSGMGNYSDMACAGNPLWTSVTAQNN